MTARCVLSAACHSISLAIALCVQHSNSPLAGAWLLFHFLGCGLMAFDGGKYWSFSNLRLSMLLWLLAIGAATFLINPVVNGATVMWILASMPMLALSMKRKYLKSYLVGFGVVLFSYAMVLVGQFALHVDYTAVGLTYHWFSYGNEGLNAAAWPLIDPNNAACVMNMGLIPVFWLTLKDWKWTPILMIFAMALVATGSKAGILVAVGAAAVLIVAHYGERLIQSWFFAALITLGLAGFGIWYYDLWEIFSLSFSNRIPIWSASMQILDHSPMRGVGLGMFGQYYAQVRTEQFSGGWFAHNDLLQIAIEMGIPAAFIFAWQWIEVFDGVCRRNLVAVCVIGAVLCQAMVEFQFYLPSISLLLGLALAWYDANGEDEFYSYPITADHPI